MFQQSCSLPLCKYSTVRWNYKVWQREVAWLFLWQQQENKLLWLLAARLLLRGVCLCRGLDCVCVLLFLWNRSYFNYLSSSRIPRTCFISKIIHSSQWSWQQGKQMSRSQAINASLPGAWHPLDLEDEIQTMWWSGENRTVILRSDYMVFLSFKMVTV